RHPGGMGAITVDVQGRSHRIVPGEEKTIALDLPRDAGKADFRFSPARPAGEDPRVLGCLLEAMTICGLNGEIVLPGRAGYLEIMESLYGARGRKDAEWHWDGVLSLDQMTRAYSCA